ncbi:PVC-type heme-binding CxxCH protein [Schlesneria sp. T3-172]|uniref:PVC-type heme-binding CxxCH protein n=1 Tax=Schlesneria sphaerica TaxID=3373610 RepID=UPI0037CAEB3D
MRMLTTLAFLVAHSSSLLLGQMPTPDDAPQPQAPQAAAELFRLPAGMRMQLVASEPLIREPSGVCFDEQGRLFVCELHGFNLDGQIDIDELNQTGKLDKVVRRFFVPEHVEEAAKAGTYGTVKQLVDTDGDGQMDRADVWADRLPACFGICPARGGVIVVCAPDIIFLADRDGDGTAEVREVLFTGFATGVLDRRMGNPQWGLDDWIYVGRPHRDATITGPHLPAPVPLPDTDFRIKADGSAIEPVSGAVGGLGHTFTEGGDRFISSIGWPAHFVVPLPWHSLARNPYVVTPSLSMQVFPDRRVYPTSKAHPWRTKRADDPGFSKFYTDGYGIAESAPNGYFTSCCGPLVYQDSVLPGLKGHLLACEPAQNLIHRSVVERDGLKLKLHRAPGEESSEFLTTVDSWFHPIALSHGPDGSVWVTDFYREIIEDYSAIPRYLQQQYGVTNGKDRGRIWKITSDQTHPVPSADMSRLTADELAAEVGSELFWRRETARRLLIERKGKLAAPALVRLARESHQPAAVINAIHTLDGLEELSPELLETLLSHPDGGVRRQVLQLAESRFADSPVLFNRALELAENPEGYVQLQLALSLGVSPDARVLPALAKLARQRGSDPWVSTAILSSLANRGGEFLTVLLDHPETLGEARGFLKPLCFAIGARRNEAELSQSLKRICRLENPDVQVVGLRGIRSSFEIATDLTLTSEARDEVKSLTGSDNLEVQSLAKELVRLMKLETEEERSARLARLQEQTQDVTLNVDHRLAAIGELASENEDSIAQTLVNALPSATPRVSEAILGAVFSRRDRIPVLLDAIEQKIVPASLVSAVHRAVLLDDKDDAVRQRAGSLLTVTNSAALEAYPRFTAALQETRDPVHGHQVFRDVCGKCHQAHGVGFAVGPDLSSEFQRAEETIIKDILSPSETISPGYMTYTISTTAGQVFTGLLGSESPTSVTLKQPEGKQQVILRNEIDELRVSSISLMPEDLVKSLKPKDVADAIAWLRQPQQRVVLLDDNPSMAMSLSEGEGTAEFVTTEKFAGESCLRITPPQRYSARIKGWEFRIREKPVVGEYRYLRFAWKSPQASGVMLELADEGMWPPAEEPLRRYFAGKNLTAWQAVGLAPRPPGDWVVITRDLWQDFGDFTLTGIAPTAIGGPAFFDRIELLRTVDESSAGGAQE